MDMTADYNTSCILFNEFMKGIKLDDYDYIILATNILRLKNGQDIYFKGLDICKNINVGAKRAYFNYITQNDYRATSCNKCKYHNMCNHLNNMADTLVNMNNDNSYVQFGSTNIEN